MTIILCLFIAFFVGVPICFALGIVSIGSLIASGMPLIVTVQRMFTGGDSIALIAIPLFMLSGELMFRGGMSKRLVDFADTLLGHFPSGLAMVSILACMFFAAITGSAIAATAAIGGIMIPLMKERGYEYTFSAPLLACGGSIGPIIPPSIPLLVYGVLASVSVADLYVGGVEHAETAGCAAAGIDEPPAALHPRINAVNGSGDLRAHRLDRSGDLFIFVIDETDHIERRQTVDLLRSGVALLGGQFSDVGHSLILQFFDDAHLLGGDHKALAVPLPPLDAAQTLEMGIVFLVGKARAVYGEPVVLDGLFPECKAVGHVEIDIGPEALGILPVFRVVQMAGKVARKIALKALDGGIKPGVRHNAAARRVVLVHAVGVVGDENIGLYAADDIAHGEARLVVIRQQPVRIAEHDRLAPELGGEGLRLGDLAFPVFGDVCSGRRALLPGGERKRHAASPVHGVRGKQRAAGQLHIADVRTDGQYRFAHGFSSFIITAKYRRGVNPASL